MWRRGFGHIGRFAIGLGLTHVGCVDWTAIGWPTWNASTVNDYSAASDLNTSTIVGLVRRRSRHQQTGYRCGRKNCD
jgi:hypothetical protein